MVGGFFPVLPAFVEGDDGDDDGGEGVGPPPLEGGIEDEGEQDAGRQDAVEERDAGFGTRDGASSRRRETD